MATVNERLEDAVIRRTVFLERHKASVVRKVLKLLREMHADIGDQLLRNGMTEFAESRLDAILAAVEVKMKLAYSRLETELGGDIADLAREDGGFMVRAFESSLPQEMSLAVQFLTPADPILVAAATSRPFAGKLLKEWTSNLATADFDRIKSAVRMGFAEGEGIDKIVRRIVGTKSLGYQDGIANLSRRQAEAVVRTAITHTANAARQEVFKANAPLIKAVMWRSTLDGRTSAVCQARSNKEYPIDSGPRPPAHINCRSTVVPVTRSWRELGFDRDEMPEGMQPYLRSTERLKDIPKSERAELIGNVPASTTYNEWLKKQPASFQDEVLGPSKAKLFRDGALPLGRFVDRLGREYTLAELRRLEPEAFKRAGM